MSEKPWGLYGLGVAIIVAGLGVVAVAAPEHISQVVPGLLTAAGLLLLFVVAVPSAQLAFARGEIPAESPVPFSESLAQRTRATLVGANTMMGWLGVFVSGTLTLGSVAATVPSLQHLEHPAFIVGTLGTIAVALGLIVMLFREFERNKKRFPADEDERIRDDLLRDQGLTGLYKNPKDPMVMMVLPANPTNVAVNLAHPQARLVAWRAVGAVVVFVVAVILLAM